jgi:hypothetical protein
LRKSWIRGNNVFVMLRTIQKTLKFCPLFNSVQKQVDPSQETLNRLGQLKLTTLNNVEESNNDIKKILNKDEHM